MLNLNLSSTGITATDPDTARSLTKMLQENKSLTHLDLSMNDSTCKNYVIPHTFKGSIISPIFQGLKHNTTLLNLNISYMRITDSDAQCIVRAMSCNRSLQSLNIYYSPFNNEGIESILDSLKFNTSLKSLYMLKSQADTTKQIVQDFESRRKTSGLPPIIEELVPRMVHYLNKC